MAEDKSGNKKFWFTVGMWAVGILLTILAGYSSVTFTNGAREQRLVNLEFQVAEQKKELEYLRENYISSKEFRIYAAGQTATLEDIRRNVQYIRDRQK